LKGLCEYILSAFGENYTRGGRNVLHTWEGPRIGSTFEGSVSDEEGYGKRLFPQVSHQRGGGGKGALYRKKDSTIYFPQGGEILLEKCGLKNIYELVEEENGVKLGKGSLIFKEFGPLSRERKDITFGRGGDQSMRWAAPIQRGDINWKKKGGSVPRPRLQKGGGKRRLFIEGAEWEFGPVRKRRNFAVENEGRAEVRRRNLEKCKE